LKTEEISNVLIVAKNALSIKKKLKLSSELKAEKVHCYGISEIEKAYFSVFGPQAKTYRLVIIDSKLGDYSGRELLLSMKAQKIDANALLVTDQNPIEGELPLSVGDTLPFSEFLSPQLDKIILEYVTRLDEEEYAEQLKPKIQLKCPPEVLQKSINQLESHYQLILNAAGEAVIGLDTECRITFANPKAGELLGVAPYDLVGRSYEEFSLDSPLTSKGAPESVINDKTGFSWTGRGMVTRSDGSFVYVEYTQSFVGGNKNKTISVLVIEDISQRMRFEKKLRKLAHTDGLTGLQNRYDFEATLKRELMNSRSDSGPSMVILLDLDGFKSINDNYGHGAGDQILLEVSIRLKESARRGDLIARLGGDEFAILMSNCEKKHGELIACKIIDRIQMPYRLGDNSHQVTCSIGMTEIYNTDTAKSVMERADSAMYHIKRNTKNGLHFIGKDTALKKSFGVQLRECIEQENIDLVYQPHMDIRNNQVVAVEVFAKFLSPDFARIATNKIIQESEQLKLSAQIDQIVIQKALTQFNAWSKNKNLSDDFRLSINLNADFLEDESLPAWLENVLASHQIPGFRIQFELPEVTMINLTDKHRDVLTRLIAIGVHIAIDGFGSSYSALNLLKTLPVDMVNIDRSITENIASNIIDQNLVGMLIQLADQLKLRVVVQGVEQESQLCAVKRLGCKETQGFYYGRPVPLEQLSLSNGVQPG
jgi:diguanylate cyclase (GGDEF)-like protein/PAS domain S-box-containing protein